MKQAFCHRVVLLAVALGSCTLGGCAGWVPIAQQLADHDGDGWYSADTNQRASLFVDGVTFISGGGGFQPEIVIVVDDRIISRPGGAMETDSPADVRVIGTWLLEEPNSLHTFTSRIKVYSNVFTDPASVPSTAVTWRNADEEQTLNVNGFQVALRSVVVRFTDPEPNLDGDSDADGINDGEEARLAQLTSGRAGNPRARDVAVLVGFTHPDWRMTVNTREKLTTVFRDRGLNLLLIDDAADAALFEPGQVRFDGQTPERSFRISLEDAAAARQTQVPDFARPFTHVMLLAEELENGAFGQAFQPGLELIVRSHLPLTGPDVHDYQAKSAMHELGHNLGLCHPTEDCPTGTLPEEEQNNATSVMGTPMEAPGPIEFLIEALQRPLDYSPTQWTNLDPASSRQ